MNTIIFMFIYIIDAIILWQYCTHLLIPKYSTKINLLAISITYTLLFLISFLKMPEVNIALFLLCNIAYIFLSYDINLITSIFHAGIVCVVITFSELLTVNLLYTLNTELYDESYHISLFIILTCISKSLYCFIICIIIYCTKSKNKNHQLSAKESILPLIVPIITFWIFTSIIYYTTFVSLPLFINNILTLSSILLLILNFIIYRIYYYTLNQNNKYTPIELQLQRDKDSANYYKKLLQQDQAQKILIHDIHKHFQTLHTLHIEKKYDKATSYINEMLKSEALTPSIRICDHELLNTILYHYIDLAKEKQISFHTDIRSNSLNFLSDDHLSSLLCNLLDNAFEAAPTMPDPYIELHAAQRESSNITTITVVNTCRKNPFAKHTRQLFTTKENPHGHGLGLKSINQITKKYNGDMSMYYDDSTYSFHTILLLQHES